MRRALIGSVLLALFGLQAYASLSSAESAERVRHWSERGRRLSLPPSRKVRRVVPHVMGLGRRTLHEIRFEEGGFAIADADDPQGSIVAFSDSGELVAREGNPLWDLLRRHAELAVEAGVSLVAASSGTVSDLRVAPLLRTKWDQGSAGGGYCYNYHTPNHYVCGCVATAMSQIMRYHEWPLAAARVETNLCAVSGVSTNLAMIGGAYDWNRMPFVPAGGCTDEEREAIGHLAYDCGVSAHMSYSESGSGTIGMFVMFPCRETFAYDSAYYIGSGFMDVSAARNALLSNLDAQCPVMLSICKMTADGERENGHEIVADGYGYADGIGYVHLNLGWSGSSDAWYALPDIGTWAGFNTVDGMTYNIFPQTNGVIVSGHATARGATLAEAEIRVYGGNGKMTAQTRTDTNGVYAVLLDESRDYKVELSYGGKSFTKDVATGFNSSFTKCDWISGQAWYDRSRGIVCGNRWGVDFDLERPLRAFHVDVACGNDEFGTGDASAPYATIRKALGQVRDGDTVIVAPGRYYGCVKAPAATVTIVSSDGPDVTFIDGGDMDCCYDGSGNAATMLCGFTLEYGVADEMLRDGNGGGVYGGTVSNCIIRNCWAYNCGGGAYCATLYQCVLHDNMAWLGGGAEECILTHCTVYGNAASFSASGVDCYSECYDSIVWENYDDDGNLDNWESYAFGWKTVYYKTTFSGSCTYPGGFKEGGGAANITQDPCFASLRTDDWRLRKGSPCLGTASDGRNMGAYLGEGMVGHLILTEVQGRGAVVPPRVFVEDGASVTFDIQGDHPLLRIATNGCPVIAERSFTWPNVRADGMLAVYFGPTNYCVDAVTGDDSRDGFAWDDALASLSVAAERCGSGDVLRVKPGVYAGFGVSVPDVTIESTDGAGATAIDADGGDLCFYSGCENVRLSGFTLRNAVARGDYGGGAYGGVLTDCVISNCVASAGGGAAFATLMNCLVAGNRAEAYYSDDGFGGGVCNCLLWNCTIAGNSAARFGGGAYLDEEDVARNAIVAANTCDLGFDNGNDIYGMGYYEAVCSISDKDARFVDEAHGDYRLSANSPCIDAGRNDLVSVAHDLDGTNRIFGARVDMGCYEYCRTVPGWPVPAVKPGATPAEESAAVAEAMKSAGFGDERATALTSVAQYNALSAWAADHGVGISALIASSAAFIFPALAASGLLALEPEDLKVTEFAPAGSGRGWTLKLDLPAYNLQTVNPALLKAAVGVTGSDSPSGTYSTEDLVISINPVVTGIEIGVTPPTDRKAYFLKSIVR